MILKNKRQEKIKWVSNDLHKATEAFRAANENWNEQDSRNSFMNYFILPEEEFLAWILKYSLFYFHKMPHLNCPKGNKGIPQGWLLRLSRKILSARLLHFYPGLYL